jgi:hypothetical protein
MAKMIIWVTGRPSLDGYAKREFKWSELHRKFIYEGREFSPAEFNAKWEKAFQNNNDLQPQAWVTDSSADAPAAPKTVAPPAVPPPPVFRPPTVDEAEAVMMRLAPERLKAKPGPKTKPKIPEITVS